MVDCGRVLFEGERRLRYGAVPELFFEDVMEWGFLTRQLFLFYAGAPLKFH
jgi:hypothetical protein